MVITTSVGPWETSTLVEGVGANTSQGVPTGPTSDPDVPTYGGFPRASTGFTAARLDTAGRTVQSAPPRVTVAPGVTVSDPVNPSTGGHQDHVVVPEEYPLDTLLTFSPRVNLR